MILFSYMDAFSLLVGWFAICHGIGVACNDSIKRGGPWVGLLFLPFSVI